MAGPAGGRAATPEQEALLADSVGLALLVVLEQLEPTERLAFVLHDVFGMPFEEIAPIVDRSVVAVRQLASRARRRVQGRMPTAPPDLREQRRVVNCGGRVLQQDGLAMDDVINTGAKHGTPDIAGAADHGDEEIFDAGLCAERCPTGAWDMQKYLIEMTHANKPCQQARSAA